ncbi:MULTISPECIES: hypothetical protein [Leisingera]|jgi:hypothetical protein|uniref:hypothetical protein n=1 Tax=Leisingera TaxID=191028 RepID=UPI00142EA9E2|nr:MULTISPECIES: hypothetical protein [Leisingera]
MALVAEGTAMRMPNTVELHDAFHEDLVDPTGESSNRFFGEMLLWSEDPTLTAEFD